MWRTRSRRADAGQPGAAARWAGDRDRAGGRAGVAGRPRGPLARAPPPAGPPPLPPDADHAALPQREAAAAEPGQGHRAHRAPAAGLAGVRHPHGPGHVPDQLDVRAYLRHSCDVTMSGGNALGLRLPARRLRAGRALRVPPDRRLLHRRRPGRRHGRRRARPRRPGPGAGGRGPAPSSPASPGSRRPSAGWPARGTAHAKPIGGSRHRLVRDAPARRPAARGLFRMLAALLRMPRPHHRRARRCALVVAGLGVPGRRGRVLVALTWAARGRGLARR